MKGKSLTNNKEEVKEDIIEQPKPKHIVKSKSMQELRDPYLSFDELLYLTRIEPEMIGGCMEEYINNNTRDSDGIFYVDKYTGFYYSQCVYKHIDIWNSTQKTIEHEKNIRMHLNFIRHEMGLDPMSLPSEQFHKLHDERKLLNTQYNIITENEIDISGIIPNFDQSE